MKTTAETLVKGTVYWGLNRNRVLYSNKEDVGNLDVLHKTPILPSFVNFIYLGSKLFKDNVWWIHVLGPTNDGWIPVINSDLKRLRKVC